MQKPEGFFSPGQPSTVDAFRDLIPGPDAVVSKEGHQTLKDFKEQKINLQTTAGVPIRVAWSERDQRFDPVATSLATRMTSSSSGQSSASLSAGVAVGAVASQWKGKTFLSVLTGKRPSSSQPIVAQEGSMASDLDQYEGDQTAAVPPAEEIAQKLNEYESKNRVTRRADASVLDQQHSQGFRQQLLSSAKSSLLDTTMLTLAHAEQFESFAVGVDPEKRATIRQAPMLVYGFEGPRTEMKKGLKDRLGLQNLRTINEYNARIGIGSGLKFTGYRKFLKGEFQFQPRYEEGGHLNAKDVNNWKEFLSDCRETFDFSGMLNTPEERKRFLIKNYSAQGNKFRFRNVDLKASLDGEDWEAAVEELGPIFELLNNMKDSSSEELDYLYRKEISEDQFKILDQMITYAFLRKTSKLGLEFAEHQKIPVIFAWKVPGEDVGDLERLHQLLEMKPYKFFPMEARKNTDRQASPEAITFSEMRHLGRLRQKMTVPIYVLVSKVEAVQQSQKGPPSPQKGFSSYKGSSSSKGSMQFSPRKK